MSEFNPMFPQTVSGPRLCDLLNYGINLGLTGYPIFEEDYRDVLNQKIVDHFYTREIGAETAGEFVVTINRRLNEGMAPINAVYKALSEQSPFEAVRTEDVTSDNESSGTSEQTGETRSYASNAPQVSMVGKDETHYYDTGTRGVSTSDATNTSQGKTHTQGRTSQQGAPLYSMLNDWYTSNNNADMMVFELLEPCFSQIFDSMGGWM